VAEHNEIKYGSSISSAAAVASGGGYSDVGISRLSESLVVSLPLWQRREFDLLRGEIPFARQLTVAAVAARFSAIEIVNASTNTKLLVLRFIFPGNSTPFLATIDTGAAIVANPVTNRGVCVDGRFPQLGEVSTCTLVTGDAAAGATLPQWRFSVTAGAGPVTYVPRWILPPGRKLVLIGEAANTAIAAGIYFTERQPFPGELQARG
jgi:hypothetical protein